MNIALTLNIITILFINNEIFSYCYRQQFLREELKYDSGYEKRHKTFHYNDDTQISVKELWEAWLRSEVRIEFYL